ncbi:sensor histidine kinase [Polymorphobacter fuscus]|uniref:histidine kinase n=1 Tax=Sandarakinorhabdus fusca TaxID=1439888 RepID=A0A7C9GQ33_9SPHN|nr:ATP-binding protein [Polymorphobacter fuscus]KAB7646240.1 PAS domain-containing protein [Polymorphobacter fuscus]MQT17453.1 PAS domain-containing protein [Polymorphobacter fuscus]NJC10010.1 C4-dicarboxylate-specific signal transduction histidine kinase [Polymorphobacter fuscus]
MSAFDRLLILAPRGRDAQVIVDQLAGADKVASIATAAEIVEAVRGGVLGVAVVTDEGMSGFDRAALAGALADQPPWSDVPFVVLTRREFGGWTRAQLVALLGNVTILERPLHRDVLISSVRSALRARARQRRSEAYLRDREAAEAQVRELAATLEARVLERTDALRRALAERDQSERRLRDSEALYRYTVELTGQTPWTAAADGRLLSIGSHRVGAAGAAPDWRQLVHRDDLKAMLDGWAVAIASAQPFQAEFRARGADGVFSWNRARAAPRMAADGTVMRWYGTLENIDDRRTAATRLRQLQAELIHVSRLSAMGAMASTLAHELNQPLAAITNYVRGIRLILPNHPEDQPIRDALDAADDSAVRAGEIVRRVRELVTKGETARRAEDLATLVREACSLAMIDARLSGIDIRMALSTAPIAVMVDRIQIQQVLLNLLRNAAEAVADSGERWIRVSTNMRAPGFAHVLVEDSGPGVAATAAARLFGSFNTTKGDGMGMGLSISRTIIEAHGGSIWHRRAPAGGAIFGFSLLRTAANAPTAH